MKRYRNRARTYIVSIICTAISCAGISAPVNSMDFDGMTGNQPTLKEMIETAAQPGGQLQPTKGQIITTCQETVRACRPLPNAEHHSYALNGTKQVGAATNTITLDSTWMSFLTDGGVAVQFLGADLVIKLGFHRGSFDAFSQTYRANPIVNVISLTSTDSFKLWSINSGGSLDLVTATTKSEFTIRFYGGDVTLQAKSGASPEKEIVSYKNLLSSWTSFAAKNCGSYLGKRYCIAPQVLWNNPQYNSNGYPIDAGYFRGGFVVTESSPLHYATSLPQDYVEAFRGRNGQYTYTPKAYSLPLYLTFELSPTQKDTWELREMTEGERMANLTDAFFQQNPISGAVE